jgi:hypothetical protein
MWNCFKKISYTLKYDSVKHDTKLCHVTDTPKSKYQISAMVQQELNFIDYNEMTLF